MEDAEAAVSAGAWAIGLNHSPESPRPIEPELAERDRRRHEAPLRGRRRVRQRASRRGRRRGRARGPDARAAARGGGAGLLRRGHRRTGAKVIKAFRVKSPAEINAARAYRTDFHLFDAYRRGAHGGTGASFDWDLVAGRRGGVPAIVAGGLNSDNVGDAIAAANPWGVDVCSGVEQSPGVKDHDLMTSFMAAANRAGEIQRAERERRRAMKQVRRAVAHGRHGRVSAVESRFGPYGGRYVPEVLIAALDELTEAWEEAS